MRSNIVKSFIVGWLVVLITGCTMQNLPQQQPTPPAAQGQEPEISVYMHETGEIKQMKMEDYVAGVVAGEMKPDWPLEALAAQALLARTFTVQAMEERGGVPARKAQASTDIKEFQAYDAAAVNEQVRRAVEMTRGQIITYQNKPIHAWFHASAGGKTATAQEGLGYQEADPPYIEIVESPDGAAPADVQNWTEVFSKVECLAALADQQPPISSLGSFTIGKQGPSGRAMTFLVNGHTEISALELRKKLGSTRLKSLLLEEVIVNDTDVRFRGHGYGHGVGLSQWGAYQLAQDGKTAEQIINHYFKQVTLEKRWS